MPPQSDAYWVGEAGPGPSYLDPEAGGERNAWTTRNTVFMTWNLDQPDHPNPEYRG